MVVILTNDDGKYVKGNNIKMRGEMTYPPTSNDTTYIVYGYNPKEDEILYWNQVCPYRLVYVVSKLPKLKQSTKDEIIIDMPKIKQSYNRQIESIFRWPDRLRVYNQIRKVPVPLVLAFLRVNRPNDMKLWRLLADVSYTLSDEYVYALLAFGVESKRDKMLWPKKKSKNTDNIPLGFRETDVWWKNIIETSPDLANEIRESQIESLPKGMKKRKEKVIDWI